MKLLFVNHLAQFARSTYTISKYVQVAPELGHEAAIFGEADTEVAALPYSLDVKNFDFAVLVVHIPSDFPDLPYLARLLDQMPRERRVVIDCLGRYNETIRIEHDFNHLEKLDGHQGWEWVEGLQALSDVILQPSLKPLRGDVRPFLFHGFDAAAVMRPYRTAQEAALAWADTNGVGKRYGMAYVGNNWQRWTQMRPFLESIEPIRDELGPMLIAGCDWAQRPDWDVQLGLHGADVDPDLLIRAGIQTREAVPFGQVTALMSEARFCPIFHRPLFNYLGMVTNRTFETFCADTIPALMLPEEIVETIYGPDARPLMPRDDTAGWMKDVIRRPEPYWDAVLKTRDNLARNHSYQQRFKELTGILEGCPDRQRFGQHAG
ncbi:MAG TPA: hypothetical protein VKE70_33395 [Candidatus Solibacter sp.]|nr:hypothetical protein [Candidatus Solibacter sp.]